MMRVCKECGREFELAPGEIKFYKSKNLALPKRCKDCRDKNKAASHNTGSPDKSYSNNTCDADITGTGFNVNNTYNSAASQQPGTSNNNHTGLKSRIVTAATIIILFIAAITGKVFLDNGTAGSSNGSPSYESGENKGLLQFRNENYLVEHFEKHGKEFSYTTKEEYLAGANKVISSSNVLHKIEAEDGDDVYYLEETNEFVIVSIDGYIRTYFKPEDGIDYYNRQ